MNTIRARAAAAAFAVLTALTLNVAAPTLAPPASANAWQDPGEGSLRYVALGDSFAAGQATDCTHTASSYPRLLDLLPRVELVSDVSCAGATTASVIATQLGAVNPSINLVTVTVGANDLGVAALQAVCAGNPMSATCLTEIQKRVHQLPALGASLFHTYSLIAAKSPKATILVTGYAPLVSTGPLNTAEQALNVTVHSAVTAVAAGGAHIRYVDVTFSGHTADSPDPWFVLAGPNIFHPNWKGNLAYAVAIASSLLGRVY